MKLWTDQLEKQKLKQWFNPFFLMFVTLSCKATYDAVIKDLNKGNKIFSDCKKENPKEAKHCMECCIRL